MLPQSSTSCFSAASPSRCNSMDESRIWLLQDNGFFKLAALRHLTDDITRGEEKYTNVVLGCSLRFSVI
jgi:hypothetical protein